MKSKTINLITLVLLIISAVMAWADEVKPLVIVNEQVAYYWPLFTIGSLILRSLLGYIGDAIDDGKLNKSFLPLVFLPFLASFSGCALTMAEKERVSATGAYIAQKVGQIALNTVLNAAVSATDRDTKTNFVQGLAQGFRTQEGSLLNADDVRALVAIWTPEKGHWRALGDQIAAVYEREQPKSAREAAILLERIAQGLEASTQTTIL